MAIECEHGHLARKCETCEYEAEIARLKERLRAVVHILNEAVPLDGPKDAEEVARSAVAAIARLKAALEAHQNDPVCGNHAEMWYCDRPAVRFTPAEDAPIGCFLCEIARLKAAGAALRKALVCFNIRRHPRTSLSRDESERVVNEWDRLVGGRVEVTKTDVGSIQREAGSEAGIGD